MRTQNSGVSFLCNADVMTSALFGTSKEVPNKTNLIYFNLGIHRCSISMVFSLFLKTAYMLLCVQTQKVSITLSWSNFNTELHNGEISLHLNPSQFAQDAPECPVLENFSLPGGPSPKLHPMKSALPQTRKDTTLTQNMKNVPVFKKKSSYWGVPVLHVNTGLRRDYSYLTWKPESSHKSESYHICQIYGGFP